jgi:hypothetical protein
MPSVNALADRWKRTVPSIPDIAMRVAFLRSEILTLPIPQVAHALDALGEGAEQAETRAREVLAAVLPSLVAIALADFVEALRGEAADRSLLSLARLLRRARGEGGAIAEEPKQKNVLTSPGGRPLTLGERKSMARRPTRAVVEKLLTDPHPAVIQNLLLNPRLTEDDLVRIASRRPPSVHAIAEIARHPRWSQRPRVRMTILQNPSTPPEISVPLVRLLIRPELHQVVAAADVPPIVRAAATELLARRPPVPLGPSDDLGEPQ